jgi:hypothetical protein
MTTACETFNWFQPLFTIMKAFHSFTLITDQRSPVVEIAGGLDNMPFVNKLLA